MDAATGLQPIVSNPIVSDRRGQQRRDPSAFRRALQQQDESTAPADDEPPVRPQLQPRGVNGRRDPGTLHVDVLA